MATQSVKVPVQLQIKSLQSSISILEKALEKVKPGTKIYDSLSQELERVKQEFLKIQIAAEKSYSSIGGIKSFEKSFDKISDRIQVLAKNLSEVDFDNLQFSEDDTKGIKDLKQQIEAIQKRIGSVKTTAFRELFSDSEEMRNVFKDLHLNINTTNAEQAMKKIAKEAENTRQQIDNLDINIKVNTDKKDKLDIEIDSLKKFKDIITNLDDPRFFRKDKSFKSKQTFIDWGKSLGLDEQSLQKLVSNGAKKMASVYSEIEAEVAKKIASKTRSSARLQESIAKSTQERTRKTEEKDKQERILTSIQDIEVDSAVRAELEKLQAELEQTKQKFRILQQTLKNSKGPSSEAAGAAEQVRNAQAKIPKTADQATVALERLNEQTKKTESIQNAIKRWFGFNEVINLTKRVVSDAFSHIRELDKVMTEIAVVTDMTQDDLWAQIDTYSQIASEYGVATEGVYKVSQLYYQQGLDTVEVMELTTETLKMAKIAGLDYADATDYMTVAIRGFKLEMSDAGNVVDVYSRIAAVTASDTEELAVAMSKTASSAEAVGSSFENTTAMIALMVETTRESPQNIGSALKSIISRYGEMTSDPSKMVDSEGEEMSLNRVDKALQSIGISLQDANGQFRDFDEVILELSSKWETLDKNSQRYIATIMAGNRQMLAVA